MSEILSIRKEKQNKYIIQSHSENERFTKFVVLNMLQRLGLKSRGFLEPDKFIFHAPALTKKAQEKLEHFLLLAHFLGLLKYFKISSK